MKVEVKQTRFTQPYTTFRLQPTEYGGQVICNYNVWRRACKQSWPPRRTADSRDQTAGKSKVKQLITHSYCYFVY